MDICACIGCDATEVAPLPGYDALHKHTGFCKGHIDVYSDAFAYFCTKCKPITFVSEWARLCEVFTTMSAPGVFDPSQTVKDHIKYLIHGSNYCDMIIQSTKDDKKTRRHEKMKEQQQKLDDYQRGYGLAYDEIWKAIAPDLKIIKTLLEEQDL